MAEALSEWLEVVLQNVEPWTSNKIPKGAKWGPEITSALEASRIGIVCLTRDNLIAPWILFEAGAISKTTGAHVCTLLLDIEPGRARPHRRAAA